MQSDRLRQGAAPKAQNRYFAPPTRPGTLRGRKIRPPHRGSTYNPYDGRVIGSWTQYPKPLQLLRCWNVIGDGTSDDVRPSHKACCYEPPTKFEIPKRRRWTCYCWAHPAGPMHQWTRPDAQTRAPGSTYAPQGLVDAPRPTAREAVATTTRTSPES